MPVFPSWWLDVKLGIRMLIKFPVLSLAGVAGIAVAVAIAAGGFSVIQRNFLASSLPLEQGDRIVALELWDTLAGQPEPRALHDFRNWREGLHSIREISAYRTFHPNLVTAGAPPESVRVAAMTASGFGVARVPPLLGRYLQKGDEGTGVPPVVVIGEDVWRNRFGSDPAILGRTIQLGASVHSVAGVMPKGFAFPVNHHFWVPLRFEEVRPEPLTGPPIAVFGRLAPNATLASARAELEAGGQRKAREFPQIDGTLRPQVVPYPRAILAKAGDVTGMIASQAIVVSLLVLVCLNVAILVYTRTAMRRAEIRLRTALGASRGRIVAQLFVEALVLAAVAAIAGVFLAAVVLRQVTSATEHIAADLPFWMKFELSPEAAVYAGVLSVLAAVIVGVVPGLQATGGGGTGMRLGKIWTVLIVAQVAFAVAILPPAVRNAWRTLSAGLAGPGFAAEEFLSAQMGHDAMEEETSGQREADRFAVLQAELFRQLEAEPRSAGVTFSMASVGDEPGRRIEAQHSPGEVFEVRYNRVAANFFPVFGVPVLAGRREPGPQDAVTVNESLARRVFRGNALGQRIRYLGEPDRWYEIVGIVSDFPKGVSPGMRDSDMKVYHTVAHGQVHPAAIAIHLRSEPAAFSERLRVMAAAVDPGLHLREIQRLDAALRKEQWISRLEAGVLLAVTASVALLCSAGIYALMSFTVAQRRREIGIRLALGASRVQILAAIFSRALRQLATGAVAGAGIEWLLTSVSAETLEPGEAAAVLVAVVVSVMTVGFAAVLGPTRQSLRIQPGEALKEQ